MSRLEEQVKPILTPLLSGYQRTLDSTAQELIATWASMKAIATYGDHRNNGPKVYSSEARDTVFRSKAPPTSFRIHLSGYGRSGSFGITPSDAQAVRGPTPLGTIFTFTMLLNHLVVRVVGANGTIDLDQLLLASAADQQIRIWPTNPQDVSWPPPVTMDVADLVEFSNGPFRPGGSSPRTNNPFCGLVNDPTLCRRCGLYHPEKLFLKLPINR